MGYNQQMRRRRNNNNRLASLAAHLSPLDSKLDCASGAVLAAGAGAASAEAVTQTPALKARAVIVGGCRTPFVKSFGQFIHMDAIDLARASVEGLIAKLSLDPELIDEVVFGNVVVKSAAPNIARELVLDAGLPKSISGTTVICQCLSGLDSHGRVRH